MRRASPGFSADLNVAHLGRREGDAGEGVTIGYDDDALREFVLDRLATSLSNVNRIHSRALPAVGAEE
jgi:hypothetical protein